MLGHALLLVVFELVLWPLIRPINQSIIMCLEGARTRCDQFNSGQSPS